MLRTPTVMLLAVALVVPFTSVTAAAEPDPFGTYDKVRETACGHVANLLGAMICHIVPRGDDLDPREWPCTCDPIP